MTKKNTADDLRHNFTKRTEVERSLRDKHAESAEAKWLRALQPTMEYCDLPGCPGAPDDEPCRRCDPTPRPTDTDEPKGTP